MSKTFKCIIIVLSILIVDQVVKILVKTNMTLYEQIPILGNWAIIHFVENEGMAFGLNLPGDYGKIILSIFRLIASVAIIFYIRHLIKINAHTGLIITLSMILAGAMGNIFDSAFYGLIFDESTPVTVATIFPEGGGYASFLHGNVVDMLYFPVIKGNYPEWFRSGQSFIFFRPVFNIADSSITLGVFIILFNQKRFFSHLPDEKHKKT
ncbi:MAG TPA: lipoprotein signal peptidase [Candidatus Marinimicrobia bacterium]|nr:lipoprotein signal peptidase [Candidatus Neomarinimicrobiota bacterium]